MKKQWFTLFILFFLFACVSQAKIIKNLYSAQIPVSSEHAKERQAALPKALAQVLIKVSGTSGVVQNDAIKLMITQARHYVREYSYVKSSDDQDQNTLLLQVNFDRSAIDQALSQAQVPIWPKNRPLTLIWLAVQDANSVKVLNADAQSEIVKQLMHEANQRGVPIMFPMDDLVDMSKVGVKEIQSLNTDRILTASERYVPDSILIGSIDTTNPKNVKATWLLLAQGQRMRWTTEGLNINDVLNVGMDNIADSLARHYGVLENQAKQNQLQIVVKGLNSANNYADVTHYLQNVTGVKNVQVANVASDSVVFNIELYSDVATFERLLRSDNVLKPLIENQSVQGAQNQNILTYHI